MRRTEYIVALVAMLAGLFVCLVLAQHGRHPYDARYVDVTLARRGAQADSVVMADGGQWHILRDACMKQAHAKW